MPSLDCLTKVAYRLRRATSMSDIGQTLLGAAHEFGFDQLTITKPGGAADRPSLLFTTMPDEDLAICEHPEMARSSQMPVAIAHNHQSTGIVAPVWAHDRLVWCVSMFGIAPDLSSRTKLILGAAAHAAHDRHESLATQKGSLDWGLSAREMTCLDFVSLGKTDVEIGRILEISPRTVRFHVQNGKAKLGVSTRVQAVAKLSAAQH